MNGQEVRTMMNNKLFATLPIQAYNKITN